MAKPQLYDRIGVGYASARAADPPFEADRVRGTKRLGRDLETGRWDERFGHLREIDELDMGYGLVVCEP